MIWSVPIAQMASATVRYLGATLSGAHDAPRTATAWPRVGERRPEEHDVRVIVSSARLTGKDFRQDALRTEHLGAWISPPIPSSRRSKLL